MHIAIVTKNLMAGGTERVIVQLMQQWVSKGITCSLVLVNKTEKHYKIPCEVKLYEIGNISNNKFKDKAGRYVRIRKIMKHIKPDIVLSMPEEIGIYVLLSLFGTRIPVVVSERNDPSVMPYKKATRVLRKLMYPYAKGLIFQTKQAAAFFSKRNQKKGIVLPNPLDLSRIPLPYEGERTKIIVSAGRLFEQKNFPLLIDSFCDFYKLHPDYRLVIYGEGPLREQLEEKAKCLPNDVIVFPGVSTQLLTDIKSASLFVLSSDFEGVPNVLIESMSMAIPVVSTDCRPGGAANLIENYKNGILVPVNDRKALSNAMAYMIEHPDEAKKMGLMGCKIKKELDSQKIAAKWLDYLISVKKSVS